MKNTIKRFQISLVLLALFLSSFVSACSSDDETVTPEITIPEKILMNGMTFSKVGGTSTLNIKSNVALEVTSSAPDWCKVTAENSTSSTILKYAVTTEANTEPSDREANVMVKSGGSEVGHFIVKQTAADGLVVESTTFPEKVPAEGGNYIVTLITNGDVQVAVDSDWIKEVSTRAAMSEAVKSFIVSVNYGTARSGLITLTLGTLTETVVVSQMAGQLPDEGMESDAMTLAAKMYAGWNLGNTLEAIGGETAWGNPKVTAELIKSVKELGFNAVRIPCSWDQYIEDGGTYKVKDEWLNRVYEVVGYCVSNDMYAIVNIHWDGGWLENNCTADKQEANNKKQKALWTQIANKLNVYDEHLLFAGCNEPNVENTAQMAVLKSYEQTFIDAVRATGGNNAVRNLIVQGPSTDIGKTDNLFGDMPTDVVKDRLMVEVHYYTPWTFCGLEKDEDWGRMAYFWGDYKVEGSNRNATSGDMTEMSELFAKMKSQFVDKGIPVILGEYGAMVRTGLGENQEAHNKSREQFNEVVTREAKNHGMVPFFWDGGTFAMIKRADGTIGDKYTYDGIMRGAKEGKYPF